MVAGFVVRDHSGIPATKGFSLRTSVRRLRLSGLLGIACLTGSAAGAQSGCAERACGLWSDGFSVLRGIPGELLDPAAIRSLAAGDPATAAAAERYLEVRESEIVVNGVLWAGTTAFGVSVFYYVGKTLMSTSAPEVEDRSSRLRREFIAEMTRRFPGGAPAASASAHLVAKQVIVDARTGLRVAAMRPFWNSLAPIDSLVAGNALAMSWMRDAHAAQTRHRWASALSAAGWIAISAAFGSYARNESEARRVATMFWSGAAAALVGPILRAEGERSARRSVGRALYLATPP